jgi:colanic acid/amylovoran biosynthesis glycosyltransferase
VKLVYVTSSLPYGPGEAFVIPEIEALRARGHDILVVPAYPRGDIVHEDAKSLVTHHLVRSPLAPAVLAGALLAATKSPRRAWTALTPMFRSRSGRILGKNLVAFVKGLWLSNIVNTSETEHVHAHWAATSATVAMVAAHMEDIPWSITAHRWDLDVNNLLQQKLSRACFVRTIDDRGLGKLREYQHGTGGCSFVLHVGIHIPSRRQGGGPPTRVLVPASLREVKGHRFLVDAIALLRDQDQDLDVDLVGVGPLRAAIQSQIDRLELQSQVRLLGGLSHTRLLDEMDAGRWGMVVLPSVITESGEQEGIPVSLLEAMARGIPVIATNTGSIPYLLQGNAGIVVQPSDAHALAAAVSELVSDEVRRRQLAENARMRVTESFDIERVADELARRIDACAKRS